MSLLYFLLGAFCIQRGGWTLVWSSAFIALALHVIEMVWPGLFPDLAAMLLDLIEDLT
ncbi:hypothetical protein [Pseudooceanicola sp. 200-1SW]|uniref:hypothetical protein n=1 Tax=Pseudooceanicola sp. 200-1SW TaxID=3425949 RepID=UPI003D7F9475